MNKDDRRKKVFLPNKASNPVFKMSDTVLISHKFGNDIVSFKEIYLKRLCMLPHKNGFRFVIVVLKLHMELINENSSVESSPS